MHSLLVEVVARRRWAVAMRETAARQACPSPSPQSAAAPWTPMPRPLANPCSMARASVRARCRHCFLSTAGPGRRCHGSFHLGRRDSPPLPPPSAPWPLASAVVYSRTQPCYYGCSNALPRTCLVVCPTEAAPLRPPSPRVRLGRVGSFGSSSSPPEARLYVRLQMSGHMTGAPAASVRNTTVCQRMCARHPLAMAACSLRLRDGRAKYKQVRALSCLSCRLTVPAAGRSDGARPRQRGRGHACLRSWLSGVGAETWMRAHRLGLVVGQLGRQAVLCVAPVGPGSLGGAPRPMRHVFCRASCPVPVVSTTCCKMTWTAPWRQKTRRLQSTRAQHCWSPATCWTQDPRRALRGARASATAATACLGTLGGAVRVCEDGAWRLCAILGPCSKHVVNCAPLVPDGRFGAASGSSHSGAHGECRRRCLSADGATGRAQPRCAAVALPVRDPEGRRRALLLMLAAMITAAWDGHLGPMLRQARLVPLLARQPACLSVSPAPRSRTGGLRSHRPIGHGRGLLSGSRWWGGLPANRSVGPTGAPSACPAHAQCSPAHV